MTVFGHEIGPEANSRLLKIIAPALSENSSTLYLFWSGTTRTLPILELIFGALAYLSWCLGEQCIQTLWTLGGSEAFVPQPF